nr:protein FAR1-related sequence 5-like [Tanacetum cinerariifolium]
MKGRTQYVHETSDDFKNHKKDVNAFIGESDAQMLINKMENKKNFVPNFMFQYLVENSELVAMFWADEAAKCNYKEFGDIISFDATFRTNKQEVLDFRMFDLTPKLHTKLTIEIHACKVYTRTISLLVQKEIYKGCWACQIQEFKKEEGCEIVKVRDIRAGVYRTIYKEEGKETVIQEKDKVVDYKVVRNPEDGSVECTCRHFSSLWVSMPTFKINTPRPSLYLHNETPRGTTYWEPNVDEPYLPLERKSFDTIEECVEFYSVYAEKGGLEVKKLAQKKTKSGLVKSKYIMCNREGVDLDHVLGKYEITKFVAKHNHQLLPKEYNHLTKKHRKMPQAEKIFVVRASTMRLGATKAHNLYSKMKGRTQYVHGTSDDFKNHIRDVNAFIGESESQMLINKMENRKNFVPNFTFQYLVENSELVAMFWADEICREIYDETDFKERFGKLVWNMFMEPLEFEEKWSKLVKDFGLQNHKWMRKMFDLRHMWLPAYFIESPLFGLMRTTSRSESENAFFKNFTNHGSTLVNFMMCFESAMERQCYRQKVLDSKTFDSAPKLRTKLTIEIHACKVYTRTISLLLQKEIYEGCWACQIQEFKKEEGCEIVKVRDIKAGTYRTIYKEEGKETVIQEKDKVVDYKVKVPNPPSQKTGDVIEDIYAIKKPKQNLVNNPKKASNKGGRKGERIKSGREIAMKAKAIRARKCGYCAEKTNKHTKTTCPLNPKYIVKLATIKVAAEQERRTATSATEQEERNSDSTHIADKEQSNTAS